MSIFSKDNFAQEYKDLHLNSEKFENIEFDECSFYKCDFSHASFKNCFFEGCRFFQCDLSLVQILNSKFSEVSFIDCKIIGVDWSKASWDSLIKKPLVFQTSLLRGSSFYGLELKELSLIECNAKDVDFTGANLMEANFAHTDFSDAVFSNTNLSKVNFAHAKNFDINIQTNILKGAKFNPYDALRLLNSLEIELI